MSEIPPEPQWLSVNPQGIPAELKPLKRWILWQAKWQPPTKTSPGRWTKVPKSIKGTETGTTIKGTKGQDWEATWGTFDQAYKAYNLPYMQKNRQIRGIGFICTGTPYTLIDFDHCINNGKTDPKVEQWVKESSSWGDLSVSGNGIHNLIKGKKNAEQTLAKDRKKMDIEIYSEGRFFTMTGHHVEGTPMEINEGQAFLDKLYAHVFGQTETPTEKPTNGTKCPSSTIVPKTFPEGLEARIKQMRWQWRLFLDVEDPLSIETLRGQTCYGGWLYYKFLFAEADANGIQRKELYPILKKTQPDFDESDSEKRVKEHGGELNYKGKTLKKETMEKYFPIAALRQLLPKKTFQDYVAVDIKKAVQEKPQITESEKLKIYDSMLGLRPTQLCVAMKALAKKLKCDKKSVEDEFKAYKADKQEEREIDAALASLPTVEIPPEEAEKILGDARKKPLQFLWKTIALAHVGDENIAISTIVLEMGALMHLAYQLITQGPSGVGKSHLLEKCLQFLPPALYKILIGATGPYLMRMLNEISKTQIRIIFLKETGGISEEDSLASQVIKMMSSDDKGGDYGYCVKNGDNWDAGELHLPENMSFMTTNAGELVDHQNQTRMWSMESDSSPEHNNAVIKDAVLVDTHAKEKNKKEFERRTLTWQQYIVPQLLDFSGKVEIPYLDALKEMFVANATPNARHVTKFRTLIEIITLIHAALDPQSRASREVDGETYWIATQLDFELACRAGWDIIFGTIDEISPTDRKLLENIKILAETPLPGEQGVKGEPVFNTYGFKKIDICKGKNPVSLDYAQKRLKPLMFKGYLKPGKGQENRKRITAYLPGDESLIEHAYTTYLPEVENQYQNSFETTKPPNIQNFISYAASQ